MDPSGGAGLVVVCSREGGGKSANLHLILRCPPAGMCGTAVHPRARTGERPKRTNLTSPPLDPAKRTPPARTSSAGEDETSQAAKADSLSDPSGCRAAPHPGSPLTLSWRRCDVCAWPAEGDTASMPAGTAASSLITGEQSPPSKPFAPALLTLRRPVRPPFLVINIYRHTHCRTSPSSSFFFTPSPPLPSLPVPRRAQTSFYEGGPSFFLPESHRTPLLARRREAGDGAECWGRAGANVTERARTE